jgi:hypothetical protein
MNERRESDKTMGGVFIIFAVKIFISYTIVGDFMTKKELEKIASDNTNDIISSLNIKSFNKDELLLLLGKIIHYYSTDYISRDIEVSIPAERLIDYLRLEKTDGIDQGLKFAGSLIDVDTVVEKSCSDYKELIGSFIEELGIEQI